MRIHLFHRFKYSSLLLLSVFLMAPSLAVGQAVFGDPSLTLHDLGHVKIEIGGRVVPEQKIRFEDTNVRVNTSTKSITWNVPESTEKIESEQIFLTAATTLGKMGDVFGIIGQYRIKEYFNGNYNVMGGGGVRISPPQSGVVKVGFLLQALYYTSEDNNIAAYVYPTGTTDDGSQRSYSAHGIAKEKIAMMQYDALLGFGIDKISYFRPYAGLLFTMIDGTDKGSFSGYSGATEVSFSFDRDISSDSSVGGIAGIVLNPAENMGVTLEGHFGSQTSYGASVFVRF